jgi:large subunit ribosomal protein L7/L12
VVKRTSLLGPNEAFRVRVLAGVLRVPHSRVNSRRNPFTKRPTWSHDVRAIGDRVATLTVAAAAELRDYLEHVYGIKPAHGPVAVPLPRPDIDLTPELARIEPTEFDVVLDGFEAARKIAVIRAVRDRTAIGLRGALKLVETVPEVVKDRLPKAEAERLRAYLEAAGARVSLRPRLR